MGKKALLKVVLIVFLLLISKPLFPLLNIEGQFSYAPPLVGPLESKDSLGFGLGIGIDLGRIGSETMAQVKINYTYHIGHNTMHVIFLGFKFVFGNSNFPDWFVIFIEGGYDLLYSTEFGGFNKNGNPRDDINDTSHGAAFAIGAEFYLYKGLYLGLSTKAHIGQVGFFIDITPAIGYRF